MTHDQQADAFTSDIIERCNTRGWPRSLHWHKKQLDTYIRLNYHDATPEEQDAMYTAVLDRISQRYVYE